MNSKKKVLTIKNTNMSDKKGRNETFWDKKTGSVLNEVDKTLTISNLFDRPGFQEEIFDEHLLRHAHR